MKAGPLLLYFVVISTCLSAKAQEFEIQRLKGFAEHQSEEKQFDRERQKGEAEFLEEQEQWERQRQLDLVEFKKEKAASVMKDDGPEFKQDQKEKARWDKEYEANREAYIKELKSFDRKSYPDLVSEKTELGLDQTRPRYDLKKRVLYGATSKYGKSSGASSGPVSFSPGSNYGNSGSGNSSFPPPPTFDDFNNNDNGYVPAPNMSDGYGDDIPPPPPPPPPMPFPDGGGDFNNFNNEIPPPPPPPMDDFGP
jgi:hypothetical protein